MFMFIESEKGSLHTISKYHHQEGSVCIEYIYRSIITGLEYISVKRYKKIAKNTAQNAGNSINGCLTGQAFYSCHAGKGK
jgi:predicted nucleotidyltransferase